MTRVALLRSGKITAWALTLVLALSLVFVAGQNSAEAQKSPSANKVAVAGSGALIELFSHDDDEFVAEEEDVTLLSTTMKNPGSKALLLSVTLECSILTDLITAGDDFSESHASAVVWVEVNGDPVAWAEDVAHGRVTFCERTYQRETRSWDDEDAVIDDFIDTKASHGFNWVALHDGAGVKTITVKADLVARASSVEVDEGPPPVLEPTANTALVIGARTLTVEPVDVAVDEALDN